MVLLRGASDQKTLLCVILDDAEKRHILLFNLREFAHKKFKVYTLSKVEKLVNQ